MGLSIYSAFLHPRACILAPAVSGPDAPHARLSQIIHEVYHNRCGDHEAKHRDYDGTFPWKTVVPRPAKNVDDEHFACCDLGEA